MIDTKDYITISATGVTVGGRVSDEYRNAKIKDVELLPKYFRDIQSHLHSMFHKKLVQINVLSSETEGKYRDICNTDPSPKHGKYFYMRLVFEDGMTHWGCCGYFSTEYAKANSRFPEYEIGTAAGCARSACSMSMAGLIDALVANAFYPKGAPVNHQQPISNPENNAQPGMEIIDWSQVANLSNKERWEIIQQMAGMVKGG